MHILPSRPTYLLWESRALQTVDPRTDDQIALPERAGHALPSIGRRMSHEGRPADGLKENGLALIPNRPPREPVANSHYGRAMIAL